ncbi:MMPL family transporter [Streptomyces sp. B1-3]|uniref:MMPL family transporter n=1 Tax=Streptomyces sp. B1-3 TaxID=3141453 RepID=UPI003D2E2515
MGKEFPQAAAGNATGHVVFEAPAGQKLTSASNRAEIAALVADLQKAPQVASVSERFGSGLVSKDGTIAYTQVTYTVPKPTSPPPPPPPCSTPPTRVRRPG